MNDVTIISYPGTQDNSLLSLTEKRSRYMLPFGGRFRVLDFTLRNSFSSKAKSTILYSNNKDGLEEYVNKYGPFMEKDHPPVRVVTQNYSDIITCYNLIVNSNTKYYILYNGDIPSIIDFNKLIKKYRSSKTRTMLFKIKVDGRASLAYKILVADHNSLVKIIKKAIDENRNAPNIFEMLINIMINKGLKTGSVDAWFWPIKNVPDFYDLHWKIIRDPHIFNLLYNEKIIQSKIDSGGYAMVGQSATITRSFVSDNCYINGSVENSIIYPGVYISDGALIRDSIILPFVKIGPGARIYRSIIDESNHSDIENNRYTIADNCKIGTPDGPIKNTDFPESLFNGITLIGKDCYIHNEARIGGGCYVASGMGENFFTQKKFLYDGTSLVK